MKMKSLYKVNLYKIVDNGVVIKEVKCLEVKPKINDYQNYFAPKLSTYYSIQFYKLGNDNCYKLYESWLKGKGVGRDAYDRCINQIN